MQIVPFTSCDKDERLKLRRVLKKAMELHRGNKFTSITTSSIVYETPVYGYTINHSLPGYFDILCWSKTKRGSGVKKFEGVTLSPVLVDASREQEILTEETAEIHVVNEVKKSVSWAWKSFLNRKSQLPLKEVNFEKLSEKDGDYVPGEYLATVLLKSRVRNGAFRERWCRVFKIGDRDFSLVLVGSNQDYFRLYNYEPSKKVTKGMDLRSALDALVNSNSLIENRSYSELGKQQKTELNHLLHNIVAGKGTFKAKQGVDPSLGEYINSMIYGEVTLHVYQQLKGYVRLVVENKYSRRYVFSLISLFGYNTSKSTRKFSDISQAERYKIRHMLDFAEGSRTRPVDEVELIKEAIEDEGYLITALRCRRLDIRLYRIAEGHYEARSLSNPDSVYISDILYNPK